MRSVEISEPITMITDYILGALSLIFAIILIGKASSEAHAILFMGFSLLASAIGAFFGGTFHGFTTHLSELVLKILWKLTIYALAASSFCFVVAAVLSSSDNGMLRFAIIAIEFIILPLYLYFMLYRDAFIYVIIHYGQAMILVIILKISSLLIFDNESSGWIIAGIVVSILGAIAQATKVSIHDRYFNHNDLFHVIQMIGTVLLFKGALLFVDISPTGLL